MIMYNKERGNIRKINLLWCEAPIGRKLFLHRDISVNTYKEESKSVINKWVSFSLTNLTLKYNNSSIYHMIINLL